MRLEDWRPERLPAQVVARALASLPRLVEQTGFLLSGGAVLLAMKGRLAKEECEPLAGAYNIQPVELYGGSTCGHCFLSMSSLWTVVGCGAWSCIRVGGELPTGGKAENYG